MPLAGKALSQPSVDEADTVNGELCGELMERLVDTGMVAPMPLDNDTVVGLTEPVRLPQDLAWGSTLTGVRVTKGAPLFPRIK